MDDYNGNGSITLEQAQEAVEDFAAVNLDEVVPATIKVRFSELTPSADGRGVTVVAVTKEIHTRVSTYHFYQMLANQQRVQKMRRKHAKQQQQAEYEKVEEAEEDIDLTEEPENMSFETLTDELFKNILKVSDPALLWQAREVLTIWKLTPGEEGMTLKRFFLGITFEQIQGLFTHFFGALLRRKGNKA